MIDSVRLLIPSINEKLTKDYDIAGFSIGDADPEALSSALRKVEMAMLPLPMDEIEQRLTAMTLLINVGKDFDPEFMALKRKALAMELVQYPADITLAAFNSIKNTTKFWPTWAEFHEFIGWRYRPRKLLRDAINKKLDSIQ